MKNDEVLNRVLCSSEDGSFATEMFFYFWRREHFFVLFLYAEVHFQVALDTSSYIGIFQKWIEQQNCSAVSSAIISESYCVCTLFGIKLYF